MPTILPTESPTFMGRPSEDHFTFSKQFIRFPKSIREKWKNGYPLDLKNTNYVFHKMKYTLKKLEADDSSRTKNSRFQVIFENGIGMNLIMPEFQIMKMNIIHHRYFVDREKEWFVKTVLATAIGFAFALIANTIGYRQGHADGLKEGKAQSQATSPR